MPFDLIDAIGGVVDLGAGIADAASAPQALSDASTILSGLTGGSGPNVQATVRPGRDRGLRRRLRIALIVAVLTGCVVGIAVAAAGMWFYHRHVVVSGVATVVVPWQTVGSILDGVSVERQLAGIGSVTVDGLRLTGWDGRRLTATGTATLDSVLTKPIRIPITVAGIPVLDGRSVHLAAIAVTLDVPATSKASSPLVARAIQDLVGAWTSDHAVGRLPDGIIAAAAPIVGIRGTEAGLCVDLRDAPVTAAP